jgi:hypothetical protein
MDILKFSRGLKAIQLTTTDFPMNQNIVRAINAHPSLQTFTLDDFRQLAVLSPSFCSSVSMSRIRCQGLNVYIGPKLQDPGDVLRVCARQDSVSGPRIEELIISRPILGWTNLTFQGLQKVTVSCCYDDFVQDDRSLGFFPRHPELRYVSLWGDQIHDLIALPKMPGLESLFSATTLQGLTGSWLFEGLTITRFPRLTPTIPWYLAYADIAIYRDTKTVLSLLLRHLPHCRDLRLVNKDKCSVVSPVALLAKCCYVFIILPRRSSLLSLSSG